ncbi:MAG: hypothetical protein PHU51_05035 [Candidatus Nanoarchaeia archaeon]|nr:hypothetical protein [Candidatus Nanoarchaeia archaeon]
MRQNLITLILVLIIISLNIIIFSSLIKTNQPTGQVLNMTGDAEVRLEVSRILAISLIQSTINFGTCSANLTKGYSILDSNQTINQVDNSDCILGTFPDYLIVSNTGTVNANVTIKVDQTPLVFFNDLASSFAYATMNYSLDSGCNGELQNTYYTLTTANTNHVACSRLYPSNEFNLSMKANVSTNASGGGYLSITFTGTEAD